MRCPHCESRNIGRHPKVRSAAPLGRYTMRWHICSDCTRSFVSLERAATEEEMIELADKIEAQANG